MMAEALPDYAPGLETCLFPNVQEDSYVIEQIDGKIPAFLRGTYYVNGPARFGYGDLRYRNWLDGDGMVCSLQFDGQDVRFTNRFVRGQKFTEETELDSAIYATFGTRFVGDRMRRGIATESPYNVSVFRFRGSLLAFGEQSIPLELDLQTLETLGEYDFDRQLNGLSPFSAHPKIDPQTGELFNFGISFAGKHPCVNYYRFDAAGKLACRRRVPIDHPCSIHDFAISKRFAVIYLSPYVLDVGQLMGDGAATIDALSWQPELGSTLLVLSRDDGREVARVPVGDRYCLHTIASFDEQQRITVDVIELDRPVYDQYQVLPDIFTDVPAGGPVRLLVDVDERRIIERQQLEYRDSPDFPAIDARLETCPYDDFWMLGISSTGKPGRKFFDSLVHATWSSGELDVYQAASRRFLGGEPVLMPDPARESGGAVICQEMDATSASSEFVIFDASNVAAGPLARLRLKTPIHLGFHASFYPA